MLRGALRLQAVVWALAGVALLAAPGWLVESVMDQPPPGEAAWLRLSGVAAVALAGQMVLVGHRVEELWWWSWTFVLLEVGAVAVLAAGAVAPPRGAPAWPWWAAAVVNGALGVAEIVALARAGTERSPV